MKLQLKKNLLSVLAFVGFIWAVYLINLPLKLSDYNLNQFGLQPRTLHGLIGIFTMPFLHHGLNHLLGNTVPLVVLLMMLTFTRPNPRRIVVCLAVMSGGMLWVVGWDRTRMHVGASGLIYALAVFLMAAGYYERKIISIIVALLVVVLYGGLFWGLLPTSGKDVSWEGHLWGAVAGGVFASQTVGRLGRSRQHADNGIEASATPNVSANSADAG